MTHNRISTKRIWKCTTLIILLFLGMGFTTSQASNSAPPTTARLQLDTAFDAYQQGQYEDAKTIWQHLSDKGMVSAQINLAALYDTGKGVAKDPARAAALYRTAAAQGSPFAQYNLSLMHIEGRGVDRDLTAAQTLLEKAAGQNMAAAFYQLGLLHAGFHDGPQASNTIPTDKRRALDRMYNGGVLFEREADREGLEKTIVTMAQLAPDDGRLVALRSKLDLLTRIAETAEKPMNPSTSFGTAWPLENGYVVTNYHVIAGSNDLTLQHTDGRQVKARPVLYDRENDLALLAVNDADQLPPALPLCNAEAPKGTSVFTMGFPRVDMLGYSPKFAGGFIENNADIVGNVRRYLTTVDIQPGNSGGPLLNEDGEVVGVVSAMLGVRDETTGEVQILPNQSCAIKVFNLHRLIDQLPENGIQRRTIAGQGLSPQALREKIKDSVLVVIAQGENG